MSAANDTHWYAVHTHPRGEMKALAHLTRQNYQVYLPRYAKKVSHARRIERVLRPFFPRYIFVRLNLAIEGWRPIRSTFGVTDIVRFGDQPTPLPSGVIEDLKCHEQDDGCIAFKRQNAIKKGDAVVVLSGPFSRLLGFCEQVTENERVAILLDLLGRKVRVLLDTEAVEAA